MICLNLTKKQKMIIIDSLDNRLEELKSMLDSDIGLDPDNMLYKNKHKEIKKNIKNIKNLIKKILL